MNCDMVASVTEPLFLIPSVTKYPEASTAGLSGKLQS